MFASTYPERCQQLILHWPYAALTDDEELKSAWVREMREHWGERAWMEEFGRGINPAYGDDPELMEWFVWMQRAAASPGTAAEFARMQMDTDIGDVLPTIRIPTVVVYPSTESDAARHVADRIPDATAVALPSEGLDPYSDIDQLTELIIRAAHQEALPQLPESVLATLLFTDLTDSTVMASELGDEEWRRVLVDHHADVRRELARFRGVEIDTAGDGFFCRFDGPARAIACARAIVDSGRARGLVVRAGIHTGECAVMGSDLAGVAVHIGARVLGKAQPGEVLVSQTVKDLVAGSGNTFDDRGEHTLKGVPGTWTLYAVER